MRVLYHACAIHGAYHRHDDNIHCAPADINLCKCMIVCMYSHRLAGSEWAYELGVTGEDEAGSLKIAATFKTFQDLDAESSAPIAFR